MPGTAIRSDMTGRFCAVQGLLISIPGRVLSAGVDFDCCFAQKATGTGLANEFHRSRRDRCVRPHPNEPTIPEETFQ
jgi:hypothetical protein